MNRLEAKMQIVFKHYLQKQWNNGSSAFELKRTKTNRLPVGAVQPHQVAALLQAYEGTQYYKIPDDSVGRKPYDCYVLQGALAYVVVGFGPKLTDFVLIPIWVWVEQTKEKTSITKKEALSWNDVEVVKIPSKKDLSS